MSTITVQTGPEFHAGDTLNAYPASSFPYPQSERPDGVAPTVAATASGTVAADGTVTLTGLAAGVSYWVGTGVDPWPYFRVTQPGVAGPVTTDGTSLYGPYGALLPVVSGSGHYVVGTTIADVQANAAASLAAGAVYAFSVIDATGTLIDFGSGIV